MPAVTERKLRKEQVACFRRWFRRIEKVIESSNLVEDHHSGREGDGHYMGDQIDNRIEFTSCGMIYTVIITAQRGQP